MRFPKVILGTFQNNNYKDLLEVVRTCVDCGITCFDTAPSYGTESILGNVKDGDLLLKINELGQRLVDNPDNDWCEHCSTHLDENDCFSVSERIYDKPSR